MPESMLPPRPDLDQLKRQAKDLLRAAQAGETEALERFRRLPAFAGESVESLRGIPLALHDAQSVIAREHGFASWKELRARVEELTLDFDAAVVQFVEAATDGRVDRAERLLERFSAIARATFYTALVLGDAEAVNSHLARDPSLATRPGGPRNWEPLLYLCHTCMQRGERARPEGLAAAARQLIALGADPNTRFPWLHHGVRRPALWGAMCVTHQLPLAEVLLEAGADPNDGVTLPLLAASGKVRALELLRAHGADPNQPWATDGSATIYAILTWAKSDAGVRWLLEHGADPDPVFAANGESPMHVIARRWDPALAEEFARRGADLRRRRADGRTPYAVALINGNRAVADWLEQQGAAADVADVDRLVAACARGDHETAQALLRARPELRREIARAHHVALIQAAELGDANAIELMLECGFDPDYQDDDIGKTALHTAAMEGWPGVVRVLLAHGASIDIRDTEFNAQPLVWAAEGSRGHRRGERDHAEVARLLIDAGSTTEWKAGEEPSEEILEILAQWQRAYAMR